MVDRNKKTPQVAKPDDHEQQTAMFFVQMGCEVKFIVPIRTSGMKTADAIIDGEIWEFKNPIKNGKRNIERLMQKGSRQARNIVVDLRHCQMKDDLAITRISKEFKKRTAIRKLIILKKDGSSVNLNK